MKPAQNAFTAFSHERASPSIGFCVTGRPGCLQNAKDDPLARKLGLH
jgi:hypothetical protein